MKNIFTKQAFLLFALFVVTNNLFAQSNFFKEINESAIKKAGLKRVIVPSKYRTLTLNLTQLDNFLKVVPREKNLTDRNMAPVFEIPMPDGSISKFHIWESSVMAPELAAQFPEIKTYTGQGIDDRTATITIDRTTFGFHAMILSPVTGSVFIDPYAQGTITDYISYFKSDYKKKEPYIELPPIENTGIANRPASPLVVPVGPCRGTQLFTYRLAIACTHEYAQAATGLAAPTVAQTLAKIVTSVNRIDGVYQKEFAVHLVLIAAEASIIFPVAAGDPFTGNNAPGTLIGESQTVIDAIIPNSDYDIGHTFSTGGGGLAGLGVVCVTGSKASGVTGIGSPVGDPYDIDYVAHEMGHQFDGNHTFNSVAGSCSGNRNSGTAYEVGSGTTIMGYAGICGADDIQPNSDPHFQSVSFDEIGVFITASSCKVSTPTNNTLPVITAMNNNGASIPINTPFTLTGAATDANGDAITYCWEEWDLGGSGVWNGGATSTNKPLFKSRVPKTTGSRTFPDMSVILAGFPAAPTATMGGLKGETLPTIARAMKFRLTVRDNRAGGGGVVTGGSGCQAGFTNAFQINAVGTVPFRAVIPNGGEVWPGNSTQLVTWSGFAESAASPVNCANVNILMSTDGGLTYPTTVLANTPNDGSESVTIPNIATTNTVRFKIECANNIFFDISDNNFTITGTIPVSMLDFTARVVNNNGLLSWKTAFESNNKGFEIYRSPVNNNHFTKIGFVAGTGNSATTQSYQFTDVTVQKNIRYYYFIKQIDFDNNSSNSVTRNIIIKENKLAGIIISPNPAKDKLHISFNEQSVAGITIQVFDAAGKLVQSKSLKNNNSNQNIVLDIEQLSAGVYVLHLNNSESDKVVKFIKE